MNHQSNNEIEAYFDGACSPFNPGGHTSYGVLVKKQNQVIWSESGYIGVGSAMSNNVGEYGGAIRLMEYFLEQKINEGTIFGDSRLVIEQMNGKWKAKSGLYFKYYLKAKELRQRLPKVRFVWIPRDLNEEADLLAECGLSCRKF